MNTDVQVQNEYGWFYLVGNRLWGASIVLFMWVNDKFEPFSPVCFLSAIVFLYFMFFGASRFTRGYRKIL